MNFFSDLLYSGEVAKKLYLFLVEQETCTMVSRLDVEEKSVSTPAAAATKWFSYSFIMCELCFHLIFYLAIYIWKMVHTRIYEGLNDLQSQEVQPTLSERLVV